MTLKFKIDTIEGLSDDIASLYQPADGGDGFVLAVDGLPKGDDVTGLKTALEAEREAARQAKAQLKEWQKLGKTPEEIAALEEEARKAAEAKAKKEGDFESILKQREAKWKKDLEDLKKQNAAIAESERKAIVEAQLVNALTKAGFGAEGLDLLPKILANRVRVEDRNGKRVPVILTEDGTPMVGDGDGGIATFDDLAKQMTTKYASLLTSQRRGGGGTPSGSGAGGNGKTMLRSEWNALPPSEQAAIIQKGVKLVD